MGNSLFCESEYCCRWIPVKLSPISSNLQSYGLGVTIYTNSQALKALDIRIMKYVYIITLTKYKQNLSCLFIIIHEQVIQYLNLPIVQIHWHRELRLLLLLKILTQTYLARCYILHWGIHSICFVALVVGSWHARFCEMCSYFIHHNDHIYILKSVDGKSFYHS